MDKFQKNQLSYYHCAGTDLGCAGGNRPTINRTELSGHWHFKHLYRHSKYHFAYLGTAHWQNVKKIAHAIQQHGQDKGLIQYGIVNILLFLLIGLTVAYCGWQQL